MKGVLKAVVIVLVVAGVLFSVVNWYSYIFSVRVSGEIIEMERVAPEAAIIANQTIPTTMVFSYAVAIKDSEGKIHTSSSEDRQWAVAKKGYCAEALFYPYPFWNLAKAGTYFNARLVRMSDCQKSESVSN